MKLKTIHNLSVGEKAEFSKMISQQDVTQFAELTGDKNPLHLDEEYAKGTMFQKPVVHGAMITGLISAVLGMKLPGPGALYASQELRYLKPVFIGDSVTAFAEVKEIITEKNRVIFRTGCTNQNRELVAEGISILLPSKQQ